MTHDKSHTEPPTKSLAQSLAPDVMPAAMPRAARQSLIETMAAQLSIEPEAFARVVRQTAMPAGASNEQFAMFLLVCRRHNLNPVSGEIYAFAKQRGGGIQPVLSIDGWVTLINRQEDLDGIEFSFCEADGKLVSCTCQIWRKSFSHPVEVTEYFAEVRRDTLPWKSHPRRMLRHKTLIQCARVAFGFGDFVDPDEAERIRPARVQYDPLARPHDQTTDTSIAAPAAPAAPGTDTITVDVGGNVDDEDPGCYDDIPAVTDDDIPA